MALTAGHPTSNLRQAGYTLLEVLYAISIVAVLSSLAALNYSTYRMKACNTVALEDLRQAYSSAAVYFMHEPDGTLTSADLAKYGFIPSPNVEVKIIHGRMADLLLTARYNAPDAEFHVARPSHNAGGEVSSPLSQEAAPESRPGALGDAAIEQNSPSVESNIVDECNRETERALEEAFSAARNYLETDPEGWVTKDILISNGFSLNENINLTIVNGGSSELSMSAIFNFPGAVNLTIDSSGTVSSAQ